MRTVTPVLLVLALCACTKDPSRIDEDEDGYTADIDCDDADASIHPDAPELCDEADNDCDGAIDDADDGVDLSEQPTYFADGDGDGFGAGAAVPFCVQPDGYVTDSTDCDDLDKAVHPDAQEICNGIDDDCDSDIDDEDGDVDLSTGSTFYADTDLDLFGDPDASIDACVRPEGYVADDRDCDDTRDRVNPDAAEACDGLDTDCDAGTSEVGLASFTDAKGGFTDVTAEVTGTKSKPARYTTKADGTLAFCPGTFPVTLAVDHDIDVVGIPADPAAVILDAQNAGSVLTISGAEHTLSVSGVTLTGGQAGIGGGFVCQSSSKVPHSLSIIDVVLADNEAGTAGAGLAVLCDLTLERTTIRDNVAGAAGAIYTLSSDVTATEVDVLDNEGTGEVGGMFMDTGTFTFDGVHFSGNLSSGNVSAVAARDGTFTWTGSTKTDSGMTSNVEASRFGALYLDRVDFEAIDVDFGAAGSPDDNLQNDIYLPGNQFEYMAGDDVSFTCDTTSCGTEVAYAVSPGTSESASFPNAYILNTFVADTDATLHAFDQSFASMDASCAVTAYVLSTDDLANPWTTEWSSSVSSTGFKSGYLSSGDIGIAVVPGRTYGVGMGWACGAGGAVFDIELEGTATDGGIGDGDGYEWSAAVAAPGASPTWNDSFDVPFDQILYVVDLD